MATMTGKRQIEAAKAKALAALVEAGRDGAPKGAAKAAAEAIVALRRLHEFEGRPDWAGRSPEYRLAIEVIYRDAGIQSDSKGSVQANLRYHVGNVLRAVAPVEDLAALGMTVDGPGERSRKQRLAQRRSEGRPVRNRGGSLGPGVIDLSAVSPVALITHAQQDVALARQLHVEDVDAVLIAARGLLDAVFEYVGELAKA